MTENLNDLLFQIPNPHFPSGKIKQGQEEIADYSYIGRSYRVLSRHFGNGDAVSYLYDQARRLTTKETKNKNSDLINKYNYGYNKVHMKNYEQRMHENGIGDVFGYDAVYRLTNAKFNVPDPTAANPTDFEKERNIFLDHVDNITRIDETKNGETSQITTEILPDTDFSKLNQYSRFDQWGLAYDKNGNLTQKGTQKMYFDFRNQAVRVTDGSTTNENKYDALGRRLQKIVTAGSQSKTENYYYAGHQVIEVRDGSDQVKRQFIYGNGIDDVIRMDAYNGSTITPYYFHTNAIGSTTAVTDANGQVVERYRYSLYGMPTFMDAAGNVILKSTIGNNILFQGREYEPETNFYYFRARHLDPIMGRFLQTDPMGYADSMNLYQAFNMNGVNFIDPMGLDKGTTEEVRWVLSQPGIETGGEFLERDFNNFLSNFKSKESFLQYSAWWLDKYGIYVPGLGAGTKMGTAVTGTTVSGYKINEVERSNRLLWGGFEFAFLWTANSLEPKPVTYRTNLDDVVPEKGPGPPVKQDAKGRWHDAKGRFTKFRYPPERGFEYVDKIKLKPGTRIDRYGGYFDDSGNFIDEGTFASPEGVSFPERALPPNNASKPYSVYEVVKPFKVQAGPAKPWFGQPGKGMQYELPKSIQELIEEGYMIKVD
jgi:RHS repeat-associated protein